MDHSTYGLNNESLDDKNGTFDDDSEKGNKHLKNFVCCITWTAIVVIMLLTCLVSFQPFFELVLMPGAQDKEAFVTVNLDGDDITIRTYCRGPSYDDD
jgi:hypothetical protein